MSYLDKTGLSHFFEKLKGVFAAKSHTHTKADIGLGNVDNVKQLPIAGGTMTGVLTLKGSQYEDSYSGALNANNSNIYNLNSIYTADKSDGAAEGIHFYRDASHVDTLWMNGGDLLFVPNRALGTNTTKGNSEKVARLPASITDNQFVMTDGTTGKLKTGGSSATATAAGLMSAADKSKLDELYSSSERYSGAGASETLNPFDPLGNRRIFIDRLDNAFYFCDKRYSVTVVKTDTSGATTEWSASQVSHLFNMVEGHPAYGHLNTGEKLVVSIDFSNGQADGVFPNYPYGYVYVDFYHVCAPLDVTARVYGRGTGTTYSWSNLTCWADPKNKANANRWICSQTGMYNMQKLELTVYGSSDNSYGYTSISEIAYYRSRNDAGGDMPYVSKMRPETLYYKLTAPKFIGDLEGDVTGKVNGHTINANVPSGAKFTDTTYTAATAAPGKVAKDSAQGTSTNYARQDHTHGIDVATGDANGQVKIAGQNISVKGLAALAYKASLAEADIPTLSIDGKTSGTLPVSRGGTGKTTAKDAANDFMNALDTGSSTPADADYYISQYVNGGNTTKTYHRRPMSALWAYIQGKIQGWAKNLTAKGNLGWTDQTAGKIPVTNNTLAYWDGRYNGSSSNLSYCAKGAFGNLAVKDSLAASDIPELNVSKITAGTFPAARLPVATEDANGIVNNTYIRKMNELWSVHEAATINNSVVSGSFATYINMSTTWQQDSYTNYWRTRISIPTIRQGAEVIVKYEDCQFLYLLDPPSEGWLEAIDGELWVYAKTQPTFSGAVDHVRISGYFINHVSIDSGIYNPPFKMELIWENANPGTTFLSQTLDLDMHAYDMALVETQALPSSNEMGITYETGFIAKGVASAIMGVAKTSNRTGLRKFTMTDAGIEVGDGIYNGGTHNDYFIPTRIYGIRGFGVFDVEPVWETWIEEGEENSNLFYEGFSASLQNNGNAVLDYGWRTYDGITGWLINTRAQGNSWAYLYSNDKIDVTNYSYIVVDCYFYCYGEAAYVGLTQQNAPAGNNPANVMSVYAHPVSTRTKFRGEVRLNVKDLTGEYRLVIASAGSGESSYQGYSMIISVKAR